MTREESILEILKTIKYPGFSRDIVSFGMIKALSVQEDEVEITLAIGSEKEHVIKELVRKIQETLKSKGDFKSVRLSFDAPRSAGNTPAPNQNDPSSATPRKLPGVKHVIAVASGKGGVGKSTVAVNLAASLSLGRKVGILDLDIYGPSLPMVVGIGETPKVTSEKKIIPLKKYGMQLMSFGFISGNSAPTIWRGPLVARMTEQFFEDVLWEDLDYLILDLPPGTGDVQLTLVQKFSLSGAVIVTTPQKLAVLDVKKGADMFRKVNVPVLGIVENMTHFLCPKCNEITEIFPGRGGQDESQRLDVPLLGKIYLTPEIALSTDTGHPYVLQYPESPISAIYSKIKDQILQLVEG
ncbi:MAG: Mrp/NBP35 family ATP-binding protein [FCB group bacterium]|nr:Mrp/NBP35 family ATP-binding protein [FCB group bacterium]